MSDREMPWVWGYAAKSPEGDLTYVAAETAEDVRWSLGSGLIEKGWTVVPVEIRERDMTEFPDRDLTLPELQAAADAVAKARDRKKAEQRKDQR